MGLVFTVAILTMMFVFLADIEVQRRTQQSQSSTVFIVLLSLAVIGLVVCIRMADIGHFFAILESNRCATFFKFGPLKFNYTEFERPSRLQLVQDKNRYYCITLLFPGGGKSNLQKFPVLSQAEQRLEDFKEFLESQS